MAHQEISVIYTAGEALDAVLFVAPDVALKISLLGKHFTAQVTSKFFCREVQMHVLF